jgi:2-dehydropantoate 2-reductase
MRIAIYGTGGAGGYFGAQLARTGEDITFIARGQHLKAIQAHGLCVETPAGEIVIQPAKATDDPTQVAPVDVILVGIKVWQVETAARDMRPIVGPETFVIPLQNGVEASSKADIRPKKRDVRFTPESMRCPLCGNSGLYAVRQSNWVPA